MLNHGNYMLKLEQSDLGPMLFSSLKKEPKFSKDKYFWNILIFASNMREEDPNIRLLYGV